MSQAIVNTQLPPVVHRQLSLAGRNLVACLGQIEYCSVQSPAVSRPPEIYMHTCSVCVQFIIHMHTCSARTCIVSSYRKKCYLSNKSNPFI